MRASIWHLLISFLLIFVCSTCFSDETDYEYVTFNSGSKQIDWQVVGGNPYQHSFEQGLSVLVEKGQLPAKFRDQIISGQIEPYHELRKPYEGNYFAMVFGNDQIWLNVRNSWEKSKKRLHHVRVYDVETPGWLFRVEHYYSACNNIAWLPIPLEIEDEEPIIEIIKPEIEVVYSGPIHEAPKPKYYARRRMSYFTTQTWRRLNIETFPYRRTPFYFWRIENKMCCKPCYDPYCPPGERPDDPPVPPDDGGNDNGGDDDGGNNDGNNDDGDRPPEPPVPPE